MLSKLLMKHKGVTAQPQSEPLRKYENSHIAKHGEELLKRQSLKLEDIENSLSVSTTIFEEYYKPLFINICELAQSVPASESDHHSNQFGYLDHVFECVVLALRKSEGVIYGSEREDKIMRKKDVFTYAVTVGAVTHDLGKLVTDIEFHDATNNRSHCAMFGPMEPGTEFIYRFYPERSYSDHRAASCSALLNVVPHKGLKWLYEDDRLFRSLIHTISGDYKLAGKLGDIIREADQYSTQKNLGRTATKFASRISKSNMPMANTNDLALQDAQHLQAQTNQINRAGLIANAIVDLLNRHQDLSNGKNINERGGIAWVTRDYVYMVTPRGFEIIKSILAESNNGIRLSMAHVCYQILFDGGFVEKINGQTSDFLTVDPDGWNKTMRFVKLKRDKIDPEFKYPEANFKIINPKEAENDTRTSGEKDKPINISANKKTSDSNEKAKKNAHDKKESVADGNKTENLDSQTQIPLPNEDDLPPEAFISKQDDSEDINNLIQLDKAELNIIEQQKEKEHHPTINAIGELFLEYLKQGLSNKTFKINKPFAELHMVDGAICLVSPNIFKSFVTTEYGAEALKHTNCNEKAELMKKVKMVQFKLFESNLHYKDLSHKNILMFSIIGANKTSNISGVLLKKELNEMLDIANIQNNKNVFLKSIVTELKV